MIVTPRRQAAQALLEKMGKVYLPNRTLVVISGAEELERAAALVPLLQGNRASGDAAVAYLCENRSCRAPTSDPEEFERQLKQAAGG